MRHRTLLSFILITLVAAAGCTDRTERMERADQSPVPDDTLNLGTEIDEPVRLNLSNQELTSPATIRGEARGPWFFEGQFMVRLIDMYDNVLVEAPAKAQGEWTQEGFVPFEAILEFNPPEGEKGRLIFVKANPSGLPGNADSLSLPVYFERVRGE